MLSSISILSIQILDFLVQVQQITDKGYDADDVEMALINSKDGSESVREMFSNYYHLYVTDYEQNICVVIDEFDQLFFSLA